MTTALHLERMRQIRKDASYEYNDTSRTLLVALFYGACAVLTLVIYGGGGKDAGWLLMDRVPAWQLHMGVTCVGLITFFVFLCILEFLETKSRTTAWRSSAPWLPLVGLTALATSVHVPIYVVFLVGGSYAVWAYRRTCSVRRTPGLRKRKVSV
jgi:hypothetical protein